MEVPAPIRFEQNLTQIYQFRNDQCRISPVSVRLTQDSKHTEGNQGHLETSSSDSPGNIPNWIVERHELAPRSERLWCFTLSKMATQ